ncbi:hypothetical protein BH11ACT8_BH11ACT8_04990 [soil metagenome]
MSRSSRLLIATSLLGLTAGLLAAVPGARGSEAPSDRAVVAARAAGGIVLPHKDSFYSYHGTKPLRSIKPGTVLARRSVTLGAADLTSTPLQAEQLLYRTQDQQRKPSVTVTTVVTPTGTLTGSPAAGAPLGIVAYLSFYDALGDICSPSYTLRGGDAGNAGNNQQAEIELALVTALVGQGYAVTVPDFEGTDLHWVAGQESGWNTLDSIRATQRYLEVGPTTKVGLFGYSGGSIGGEWAAELAPHYAPELTIAGAALGGLPVHLGHNLTYVNGSDDWSGVIPAVLVSLGRAFDLDIASYQSAYGKKVARQVGDQCISSFNGNYPGLRVAQLLKPRYKRFLEVPAFARIVNRLIMGSTPGHPHTKLFLGVGDVDGTGDNVMIKDDVMALGHQYCKQGVKVRMKVYPNSDHSTAGAQFFVDAMAFLDQRMLGVPFPGYCSAIKKGNSLAPLPVRHR